MSFRTVVLMAAAIVLGIACVATATTEVLAREVLGREVLAHEVFAGDEAGTTRLDHQRHHRALYRRGHLRQARVFARPPVIVGAGAANSPYCWPYDYSFDPAHYCGASFIVSW